jgi:hypothetical protein
MPETNIITLALVTAFAALFAYRLSFLRTKMIGHFSLLQIFYLVVIPGFLYTFVFAYIQSILQRPLNKQIIVSDGLLVNIVLLSALFAYGGVAIHATSKALSEALKDQESKAKEINKFFHLTFSHNLAFSGAIVGVIGTTLLELNHASPHNFINPVIAIIKGIILGLSFIAGLYWYNPSEYEERIGRWSDLKMTFFVFWIGVIFVLYGIKKTNPVFKEFDMLIPTLASFSIIGSLNMFLIYRKLKRGGFKLFLRFGKIKKRLI